ncbi:MAG: hypothetical protein KF713_08570 [Turneriella sp.]|nr:hypothetical protein [Turneriella sp.]
MQLSSLLNSMRYYCQNVTATHVLYAASDETFAEAYARLQKTFSDVVFLKESNFRIDLIRLLSTVNYRLVFFLVDDLIFTDFFDASMLSQVDTSKYVLSLRLHPGVTYSYMTHLSQKPPPLKAVGQDTFSFSWKNDAIDWAYPLSVDGHIFERKTILSIINKCQFRAPNSLEASMQAFTTLFSTKFQGLCYKMPKIVNFPVNRVQIEFENRAGENTAKEFLDLFHQGYEIDFLHYEKSAHNSVHVDTELALKKK